MLYTARNGCYPALVVGDGVLTLRPMFNIILTHTKEANYETYNVWLYTVYASNIGMGRNVERQL